MFILFGCEINIKLIYIKRAATAAANKKARQDKLDAEATADKKRDQSYDLMKSVGKAEENNRPLRQRNVPAGTQ